ncbi:MAG: histidinol-phosphatase HisJ family protein [Chloroflexi bacterium]|nr:histidinol-phosphatase HisJ family protein [Chloroflexota bacterium]
MMKAPILYDSHMHTPLCKHAIGEPESYAAVAEKRGLKGIIFTCHNPGPNGWSSHVRMSLEQFDEYVDMVERARGVWNGRVDVLLGLESDYVPGMESFLENLHARADFNHILGSIHPQLSYYRRVHDNGDPFVFFRTYFDMLAQAAETGLFDTLSHPDLVKNVYPRQWRIDPLLDDIRDSLDRIAAAGVAMELNTSGLNKRIREMNPNPQMLAEMQARGIPIVLGSDSHEPGRVAADFERALALLAKAGYTAVSHYIGRQRHEVKISEARTSLNGCG